MKPRRIVSTLVASAFALLPATAWALQGDAPGAVAPTGDYRAKVYTACSLVFLCILVYLFLSFRQNAKLREELEFVDRRLKDLESGDTAAP